MSLCSTWPNNTIDVAYGCSTPSGGVWESLDNTMNTSDTLRCAILCLQKQEVGCCYLGNEAGCYWYAGGLAGAQNGDNGAMAVTCNSGKSQIILLLSLG